MNAPRHQTRPATGHGGRKVFALLGTLLIVGAMLYLSDAALRAASVPPDAVAAATAFLDSLDAKQREKALLGFDSNKKSTWSNLPVTMVQRNGIALGDMTKEQRAKAMDVLAVVLSKDGYQKMIDIMDSDQQLVGGGRGGRAPMFGKDLYYLAIFGKPSPTEPWMVQFGGHHLGVNVTVIGKHFILTPTHTGAQPARFQRDGNEVRPLGREADAGYKLMASLDAQQRTQAIIGDRPQGELLLGPGRDGRKIEPKGIKGSALTEEQQKLLLDVIAVWVNTLEADAAAARMAAIRAKIGDTYFAWSGPTEPGKAASFRVQGPTIVIEYAPQRGTDHIHTVIRNPEDDYGMGMLKK
jgi:hypothetical protein